MGPTQQKSPNSYATCNLHGRLLTCYPFFYRDIKTSGMDNEQSQLTRPVKTIENLRTQVCTSSPSRAPWTTLVRTPYIVYSIRFRSLVLSGIVWYLLI